MRLHTTNRRAIQKATKGAKLRGVKIGGGGESLTPSGKRSIRMIGAHHPRTGPAPMPTRDSVMGSIQRRGKRGDNPMWGDVLDLVTIDGAPAYIRLPRSGEIRKSA